MSADNGIYILRTPMWPIKKGIFYQNIHGSFEYRVAHCQAIENIDYSDLYMPLLFGKSKVFYKEDEAFEEASRMEKEILENDCVLEYGICQIERGKYFPRMTSEEAYKALDVWYDSDPRS